MILISIILDLVIKHYAMRTVLKNKRIANEVSIKILVLISAMENVDKRVTLLP